MDYLERDDPVRAKFESLHDLSSQPCIYKAPDHLRQVNEECYLPYVISIGPSNYGRPSLEAMQECKWRCLRFFLEHAFMSDIEHYRTIIRDLEGRVRECYAESVNLSSDVFNEMVLIDSAFIICLFMEDNPSLSSSPLLFDMNKRSFLKWEVKLRRDLFLEENQIPFFILEHLFNVAFGEAYPDTTFVDLACRFIAGGNIPLVHGHVFTEATTARIKREPHIEHLLDLLRNFCFPSSLREQVPEPTNSIDIQSLSERVPEPSNSEDIKSRIKSEPHIAHLLDSLRNFCFPSSNSIDNQSLLGQVSEPSNSEDIKFPSSASNLRDAGVKFVARKSTNLLDIKFSKGVLEIPPFQVWDVSESYFRSLILFEQSHLPIMQSSYLLDYIIFLEKLIRTQEDVRIFVQCGIIVNWIGSEESVARLFNGTMTKHIALPVKFYYLGVCQDLNAFANTRWNQWKTILKRDYFSHPWATISVIYALMLLILALLQTIGTFIKK